MELSEFEKEIIEFIRKRGIKSMERAGQLILHFNDEKKPQKVELWKVDIKEIW